jgi:phage baseplate assembly protein W
MSGRHLAFPFHIAADGRPATPATLEDHVKSEIIQLLLTDLGERPFQPSFGGGLKRLVFETNDDVTAGLAKARISKGLSFWLGERIEVKLLEVTAEDAVLSVELVYSPRAGGAPRRLRFEHRLDGGGS